MKSYFNNDERIAKLVYHAEQWLGTPWCANSSARGERGGVSCHNLPRAILMECGALPKDFPVIKGDPTSSCHSNVSTIVAAMDSQPAFSQIPLSDLAPGDLVGIRIRRCVDHLGLVLPGRNFIHVLMHKTTMIDPWHVPPWAQRIEAAWRVHE